MEPYDGETPWLKNYEDGVPFSLVYPRVPLTHFLRQAAEFFPQNPSMVFAQKKFSYRELQEKVNALANALVALGVKKGERVALLLPNSPPYVIGYYAILQVGAIVVNLNPLAVARELLYFLNHAEVRTVIVAESLFSRLDGIAPQSSLENILVTCLRDWGAGPKISGRKKISLPFDPGQGIHSLDFLINENAGREAPRVNLYPEDEALLQYTGAITEGIKGVVLTHGNLVANTLQISSWVVRARPGKEVFLSVLPFFHVYGMAVAMNVPISLGSAMIILPRFEVRGALKAIKRFRPTFFPGVPPMFVALSQEKDAEQYNLSCLRVCYSGGAPLSLEILEDFEKLTGTRITEGYGLAEASPATHCNPIFGKRKLGSVGLPYPDTLGKIVDLKTGEHILGPGEVGELCIKGPQVMKGYWKMPEETARTVRNGWLYTGDIARMDEEGYFNILDIKKDMIIAGGFNIYPKDIDQILTEHPQVAEAVAVGFPDRYRGEAVKAFVVLKPGQSATEEEILEFCRKNLAKYKVPTRVEFRQGLPKSPSGKILRRMLRQEAMEQKQNKKGGFEGPRDEGCE
ncbi:MAG: long-chain fatty acid--CoA ligase [Deltaproteobacteria bacterium]|nr:long-chain fatty acid--CoA ligase [Deltaproteobacteria bacterium]